MAHRIKSRRRQKKGTKSFGLNETNGLFSRFKSMIASSSSKSRKRNRRTRRRN